jgi:hypothetical protein
MTSTRRKLVAGGAAFATTAIAAVLALTAPATAGAAAPVLPPPPPNYPTFPPLSCGQATHVWAATPGGSLGSGSTVNIPAGSSIYLTGVVFPGSAVTYHFHYSSGLEQVRDTTNSDTRCVVHHEENQYVTASDHEQIVVTADYYPWEVASRPAVFSEFIGTINLV